MLLTELRSQTESESTAIAILQEIAKDKRTRILNGNQSDQNATEKQLAYLEKLEVEHDAGISKSEASRLIDEALQKEREIEAV